MRFPRQTFQLNPASNKTNYPQEGRPLPGLDNTVLPNSTTNPKKRPIYCVFLTLVACRAGLLNNHRPTKTNQPAQVTPMLVR